MAAEPHSALPEGYRLDPQLGVVYDSIPHSADDLTAIRGIETREAAGLNQLGIYYYEQIAGWNDSQVVAVADAMGTSASSIFHDRWMTQAHLLCTPAPPAAEHWHLSRQTPGLPASGSRTITLLIGALLVGCFFVAWLNRRNEPPMPGVLAAEITCLRVPADGRLLATHVTAGDEVFTGEVLLTLEKTEHVQLIADQSQLVHQLKRDLQKAEAQASIELQWRSQQLQQELSDVKRRARYLQTLHRPAGRSDLSRSNQASSEKVIHTVARPHRLSATEKHRINSLLFINGVTGSITSKPSASAGSTVDSSGGHRPVPAGTNTSELLRLESESVQARLQQLQRLRASLPTQIKMAAGVEHLQTRLQDAQDQLAHMKSLNRETSILCPGYGTVGQVRYADGDHVSRGDVLVRILHNDRCFVMVHAPSHRIAELKPGTHVSVRFPDHDPCEGIVAGLPVIADQPAGGTSMASIRIESVGRHWPDLPVGSKVQVVTD